MGTMSVGKDAITQYLAKSKAESATAVSAQQAYKDGGGLLSMTSCCQQCNAQRTLHRLLYRTTPPPACCFCSTFQQLPARMPHIDCAAYCYTYTCS
jgi:hypothetical protein